MHDQMLYLEKEDKAYLSVEMRSIMKKIDRIQEGRVIFRFKITSKYDIENCLKAFYGDY